jgi:hypothetical protein
MSDIVSKNSEDPDARPVNERSSAFIDGVAYLEFARLKSFGASRDGHVGTEPASPEHGANAASGISNDYGHAVTYPAADARSDSQIDIADWDSLFGAVEERLRKTVEKPDQATTPATAKDNASRIKSVVLDCVSALDKLHKALRQERSTHAVPHLHDGATSDSAVAPPLTSQQNHGLNN